MKRLISILILLATMVFLVSSTQTPIIQQSYTNDRYFKINHCNGQTAHIYNKTGIEISSHQINSNQYIFSVDRNIEQVTIKVNTIKQTFTVTPSHTYLRPYFNL